MACPHPGGCKRPTPGDQPCWQHDPTRRTKRRRARSSNGNPRPIKRKDGRFVIYLPLGVERGQRRTKAIYGRAADDCLAAYQRAAAQMRSGVTPGDTTVEQWVSYFLASIAPLKRRGSSNTTGENYARQWIYPQLGHLRLDRLTVAHIRTWHANMREYRGPRSPNGLAKNTIHRIHAVLQAALTQAVTDGKIPHNVAQLVSDEVASDKRAHHDQLTPTEARALLDRTSDPRLRARIAVALMGLRQGEALALQWDDYRTDDLGAYLAVQRSARQAKGRGVVIEDQLKTAGSVRDVRVAGAHAVILDAWRSHSGGDGWIFPGHDPAKPDGPRRDYRAWADALKTAGVRHVPLHGARGTSATRMSLADPLAAAAQLGHAKVDTTINTYSRASRERQAAVAELAAD